MNFFGLGPDAFDALERGLLFWQYLGDKPAPQRLSLVTDEVAQLWRAPWPGGGGRTVKWARLGVALFEQLPKNYLAGAAGSKWRVASEGMHLAQPMLRRRRIRTSSTAMVSLLTYKTKHHQATLESLKKLGRVEGQGVFPPRTEEIRGTEKEKWHECGSVVVGFTDAELNKLWIPGVLTPLQLRLLVDEDAAASTLEVLQGAGVRTVPSFFQSLAEIVGCCSLRSQDADRTVGPIGLAPMDSPIEFGDWVPLL